MADDYNPLDIDGEDSDDGVTEALEALIRSDQDEDLRWLVNDKRGRRIMWRLLSEAGVYRQSYLGSTEEMVFREGQRSIGLLLLDDINRLAPERYHAMVKERKDYEQRINHKLRKSINGDRG